MDVDPQKPKESVQALREAAQSYKDERLTYYRNQMRRRTNLVNRLPTAAAVLGVIGILLTSGAVIVRTLSVADSAPDGWANGDIKLMAVALAAYALMSAMLIFERLTESSGGYFRAAETVVLIRDLWTAYQFGDIARSAVDPDTNGSAEIERWRAPIETFCKSLDAIVGKEMTAWQTAYRETAKLLSDTADSGLKSVITEIKAAAETAAKEAKEKAEEATKKAEEATAKAEEAAKKAQEAAKASADAQAPATLNLSLGTATTAGTAVIKIDGKEEARGVNQRSFSFTQLKQGEHHLRVEFTPSADGSTMTPFEKSIRLAGGINAETIAVP
ncbi:MAG TPA: hypothetical protein VK403_05370 [Allosphingosinicella sp.]|nr:hypothetical protein [Allosphingosinicella sp.]